MDRVDDLRQRAFEERSHDGFLVSNAASLLYFTHVPGTSCLLIPRKGEATIYVYSVNYEQARAEGKEFKVEMVKRGGDLMGKIASDVKALRIKKLAADALSVENYRSLAKELRGRARVKIQENIVWDLRKVKDENELRLMRKAGELTSIGMRTAYETMRPGMKEIEVAAEIEYAMRKSGSWGTAFETSVASGTRSAFPHGGCTDREIRKGDLVVVDLGAAYQRYCSDITRTMVAGKPSEKQKKLYEIVKTAQEMAGRAVKPKTKAKDVDAVARKVIGNAGYGEFFVHGLGHGVGIEVHEPPTLSPQSNDRLKVGNVVTNEPGIYLIGFGGIRIEDTVLVQRGHAEKLTEAPYVLETER